MKVLLENYLDHVSAHSLYDHLRTELIRHGHGAAMGSTAYMSEDALREHDVLISNRRVPPEIRRLLLCYGGNGWSRPQTLNFLREHGVETMTWCLAADQAAVRDLFDRWGVERMLLKRSDTMKGLGVEIFAPDRVNRLIWDPAQDVFCTEVHPDVGDLYKAELFHGELIISWMAHLPPIRVELDGRREAGQPFLMSDRALCDLPSEVVAPLKRASRAASREGVGYVSVDIMRDPEGCFRVVEMNVELVATWWTAQFPFVKERYAAALLNLLEDRDEMTKSPGARAAHA